jgi:hypothetical protein
LKLQEELTKQYVLSQPTARKLTMTETVNRNLKKQLDEFKTELELSNSVKNDLKKQLEMKEKVVQINTEKNKQLQTTVDGLTKIVDLLNQTVQDLCQHPEDVSTVHVS